MSRTLCINTIICAATVLMLGYTIMLRAADPATKPAGAAGVWKWTAQGPGGDQETTLTLKQDGDKLTGSITGFGGQDMNIEDGMIKGNEVSFQTTADFNGNKFVTKYTATLSGDSLKGKSQIIIENQFEGKRS